MHTDMNCTESWRYSLHTNRYELDSDLVQSTYTLTWTGMSLGGTVLVQSTCTLKWTGLRLGTVYIQNEMNWTESWYSLHTKLNELDWVLVQSTYKMKWTGLRLVPRHTRWNEMDWVLVVQSTCTLKCTGLRPGTVYIQNEMNWTESWYRLHTHWDELDWVLVVQSTLYTDVN